MKSQHTQDSQLRAPVIDVSSFKPLKFRQRGGRKVAIPVGDAVIENRLRKPATNRALLLALARAFYWARLIDQGVVASGSEIAIKEGLEASTVNERLRMKLLSPAIIERILNGTQPEELTMNWLTRNSISANWEEQEKHFNATNQNLKNRYGHDISV
ncbi:hypothetical protein [Limnohabitans sp.]|uniref:hypothetical protein n=1 Tax=Limnohabitans sp. TaxID=1907725 RepID=UPI00286F922D|nr:hypothetical protein [Limnohabitans sp.]